MGGESEAGGDIGDADAAPLGAMLNSGQGLVGFNPRAFRASTRLTVAQMGLKTGCLLHPCPIVLPLMLFFFLLREIQINVVQQRIQVGAVQACKQWGPMKNVTLNIHNGEERVSYPPLHYSLRRRWKNKPRKARSAM